MSEDALQPLLESFVQLREEPTILELWLGFSSAPIKEPKVLLEYDYYWLLGAMVVVTVLLPWVRLVELSQ